MLFHGVLNAGRAAVRTSAPTNIRLCRHLTTFSRGHPGTVNSLRQKISQQAQLEQHRSITSIFRQQANGSCKFCDGVASLCQVTANAVYFPFRLYRSLPNLYTKFLFCLLSGTTAFVWGAVLERHGLIDVSGRYRKLRKQTPIVAKTLREGLIYKLQGVDISKTRYYKVELDTHADESGDKNEAWAKEYLHKWAKGRKLRMLTRSDLEIVAKSYFMHSMVKYHYEQEGHEINESKLAAKNGRYLRNKLADMKKDTGGDNSAMKGDDNAFDDAYSYFSNYTPFFRRVTERNKSKGDLFYADEEALRLHATARTRQAKATIDDVMKVVKTKYFERAINWDGKLYLGGELKDDTARN